jgi:hypothetical protein
MTEFRFNMLNLSFLQDYPCHRGIKPLRRKPYMCACGLQGDSGKLPRIVENDTEVLDC